MVNKVAVIILNYNSSDDCRKCVSFLKRQEGVELELILVDNCSPDGDKVEALCQEEGCTFIPSKENRGYNAGNNIGLRYAAHKGYKYALITNPDMEFYQSDYVKKLVYVMERDEEVVLCGSDILGVDGMHQNPWSFTTIWDDIPILSPIINVIRKKRRPYSISGYCDILTGCCFALNLNFISSIGYLDENVFLYCEEAILGKQIQYSHKKSYYLHEAQAIHRHIESTKGSFKKRYNFFWESRWYYLKTYSGYNKFTLALIYFFRVLHYYMKCIYIKIKGLK